MRYYIRYRLIIGAVNRELRVREGTSPVYDLEYAHKEIFKYLTVILFPDVHDIHCPNFDQRFGFFFTVKIHRIAFIDKAVVDIKLCPGTSCTWTCLFFAPAVV